MPFDDEDDSKYITDEPAAPARRKGRAYDKYQPPDAPWSLDRLSEVQTAYQQTFGRTLPLTNKGQGSVHNRLGLDHRDSADVSLNPSTTEGQQFAAKLRELNVPFLAFDRAIPNVATGPHFHIGRPSHRGGVSYPVGTQARAKKVAYQQPANEDAKYVTDDTPDEDAKYVQGETNVAPPAPAPAPKPVTATSGDLIHHFGLTSAEWEAMSSKQRQRAAQLAGEAAAEDQRKRAAGQTAFPVDTRYQSGMRQKIGLPAIQEGMGAGELRRAEGHEKLQPALGMGDLRRIDDREVSRFNRISAQVRADREAGGDFLATRPIHLNESDEVLARVSDEQASEQKAAERAERFREITSTFTPEDHAAIADTIHTISGQNPYQREASLGTARVFSSMLTRLAGLTDLAGPQDRNVLGDYLRRQAAKDTVSADELERSMPPEVRHEWVQFITKAVGALPEIYGATAFAGPVGGFAALGGLEALGSKAPAREVLTETAKGATIGKVFQAAGALESPAVEGVEKTFGRRAMDIARSGVGIGAGTYGVERGFGATHDEALQSAASNLLFHGVARGVHEVGPLLERALKTPESEPLGPSVPEETQNRLQARDLREQGVEVVSEPGERPRFRVSDEQLRAMQGEPITPVVETSKVAEPVVGPADAKYITDQPAEPLRTKRPGEAGFINPEEIAEGVSAGIEKVREKLGDQLVEQPFELAYYAKVLDDPTLVNKAVKILDSEGDPAYAIPVGGKRRYGELGAGLTKKQVLRALEILRSRPGFPDVRTYGPTRMPDGKMTYGVEWGVREGFHEVSHEQRGQMLGYSDKAIAELPTIAQSKVGKQLGDQLADDRPANIIGAPLQHTREDIAGKEIVAQTADGRVVVPNEANKSGVSVVRPHEPTEADTLREYRRQLTTDYRALTNHQARREGLGIVNDDTASNYFDRLRRFVATHNPEKAGLVEQAEDAYAAGRIGDATLFTERALSGTHDFASKVTGAEMVAQRVAAGKPLTEAQLTWRETLREVQTRLSKTGGPLSVGGVTYDVNKYPEGGRPDHEKIAYILEPVMEKLRADAARLIAEGKLKASEWTTHLRTEVNRLLASSDFADWHPLNKSAALGVMVGKLKGEGAPIESSLPKTLAATGRDPGTKPVHEQLPNVKTMAKVTSRLATEGPEAFEDWYRTAPESAERTAAHQVLVDHYQTEAVEVASSNPEKAAELRARAVELSNIEIERAVTVGQTTQAYSMLLRYTPAGIAREIAKAAKRGVEVPAAEQATATATAVEHQKADTAVRKAREKVEGLEAEEGGGVAVATGPGGAGTAKPAGKGPGEELGKGAGAGAGRGAGRGGDREFESVAQTTYRRRTSAQRTIPPKSLDQALKDLAPNDRVLEGAQRMLTDTDLSRWMRETKSKYGLDQEAATKLGKQSHDLLRAARKAATESSRMATLRKKYPDASTDELVQAKADLDAAIARRRSAKLEMARFFDRLNQKQQGYYRRSMNITRAMMVSAFATAARNAQSQAWRFGTERFSDLTEHVIRRSVGLESDFTARSIARNTLRAFKPSERLAREIASEHPEQLARLFNSYAGGVEIPQFEHGPIAGRVRPIADRMFGGMEKAAKLVNFANQLQEFHLRAAEFLSEVDLHLRKDHDLSLEKYISRYGIDAIPQEIVAKGVQKALEVTFADSPGREGPGGRLLTSLIDVGNYIPPTISPAAFPKFMFNSLKFLYQYNPTGMIDLARKGQNKPRVIARALTGTAMLLTAYQFRKSDNAGEKWYEIKVGGKTLDTRPFGPFSTYLFLGEAIRRGVNGEQPFKVEEIAEAIGASSGPGGSAIAVAEKLYNYSTSGQWDKFQRILKTEAGDFGRALLTPVRQVKDLVAAFDPEEGYTRDTSDAPFTGAIRESIPGLSRGLPVAGRPTSTTPIHQEHPAIKALTGWRVETPKTFIEKQLDELHFESSEVRPSTGLPKIDAYEKKAMGPLMDQLSKELEADEEFKKLGPAQRADIISDALHDIREEVRDMGKAEMPEEYDRLKEERKPRRKKALEKELENSPGLSKALQLGVPMGIPAMRPDEDDLGYRARLLQVGKARRTALDHVVASSGFRTAPITQQRIELQRALTA